MARTDTEGFIPQTPSLTPSNSTALNLQDLLPSEDGTSAANALPETPQADSSRSSSRGKMTIAAHINEFRKRLVSAAAGIALATIVGWIFSEQIFQLLQQPFLESAKAQKNLMSITFSGVASAFDVRLQIGIFIGVIVSCPWWTYQIWAFINPGLSRKERRHTLLFIGSSVPLFLLGAWLSWTLLPQAIAILTGLAPAHTSVLLDADTYFTFILRMTVAFGLAFLLPVVMVALTVLGAVSSSTWISQWRIAVLSAFIFAAVATPTGDAGTLCALALPICIVYFGAVGVCATYEKHQILQILSNGHPIHYLTEQIKQKLPWKRNK